MSGEQLAAAGVLAVLGTGVIVVGLLGRRGTLDFALGGWTTDTSTPASWARAHRTIGSWFVGGGVVALVGAAVVLVGSARSAGPATVVGSVASLVPVIVGVVRGLGQLERRT